MIHNEPGSEPPTTNGVMRFSFSDANERAEALRLWPDGVAEVEGHEIVGSWTRFTQYLHKNRDSQLRMAMALGDRIPLRIVTGGDLAPFVDVAANTLKGIDRGTTKPRPDVLKQFRRRLAELWQYAKAGPVESRRHRHWIRDCITVGPGQLIAAMVDAIVSSWEQVNPREVGGASGPVNGHGHRRASGHRFPLRVAAFQLSATLNLLNTIRRDTTHLPQHLIDTLYVRWMSLPTVRRLLEPPALFNVSELHAFADNLERICQSYSPHTLDSSKARSRQSMDVVLLDPWPLLPPFVGMVYDAIDGDSRKSLSPLLWSAAAITEEGTLGCEIPGAYLIPPDGRRYETYKEMLTPRDGPSVRRFLQELRALLPSKPVGA